MIQIYPLVFLFAPGPGISLEFWLLLLLEMIVRWIYFILENRIEMAKGKEGINYIFWSKDNPWFQKDEN